MKRCETEERQLFNPLIKLMRLAYDAARDLEEFVDLHYQGMEGYFLQDERREQDLKIVYEILDLLEAPKIGDSLIPIGHAKGKFSLPDEVQVLNVEFKLGCESFVMVTVRDNTGKRRTLDRHWFEEVRYVDSVRDNHS